MNGIPLPLSLGQFRRKIYSNLVLPSVSFTKGTVIQIEKALINDSLRVSKVY